ncbi:hypothetical protein [Mesomycoplasma dispar]|uniref:hypothetical protein n=1 Tax=Mesomycoplasma dispar TaxID=86660 RepID=UPI0012FE5B87|nr:hypothetical protein [Mesomycoplasma dispar]
MKSILLFYRLIFFKPIYSIINALLFFFFLISLSLQQGFPEQIVLLRVLIFSSISLLVIVNASRYIWFILKYKKEVLSLSNEELEEKYPKLSRIAKKGAELAPIPLGSGFWLWWNKLPIIASKFGEENAYQEKRNFLYKIHLKFYIIELFLVSILILSSAFLLYIFHTEMVSLSLRRYDLSIFSHSDYSLIPFLLFLFLTLFSLFWIVHSRGQLTEIAENLLTDSIEKCKKAYKSTLLRFYLF